MRQRAASPAARTLVALLATMSGASALSRSAAAMPAMGFGCWKLDGDAAEVVYEAVKAGYRHFDGAADYANEVEVGAGLKRAMDEGLVTREELWVTSKLWNTNHRPENVEEACRKTLADLGLDHLDLYLMHFPISIKYVPPGVRYPPGWVHDPTKDDRMIWDPVPLADTWAAMEKLVEKGLVKNIGLCNCNCALIMDLWAHAKAQKPKFLQVELHPYQPQPRLLDFCRTHDIHVTAYSPFGSVGYASIDMDQNDRNGPLEEPAVLEVAKKHGKTPAQVILAWHLGRGTAVIPKSSKPARMAENFAASQIKLDADDVKLIESITTRRRYNDPGLFQQGADLPIFD